MTGTLLEGTRVVVTGAARGLGRAMSLALAEAGATVVATDVDEAALAETVVLGIAGGGDLRGILLDITDEVATERVVDQLWESLGGIDVVIANAGIVLVKPALEMTNADMTRVFDVNVLGTFATVRTFGRRMLEQGHGKVVMTASQAGLHGSAEWIAYCASKAAVISMTQTLASEWGPTLTVNAIAPGAVLTDINAHLMADPEYEQAIAASVALQRVGRAEEFGPIAVFLSGSGSNLMSGSVVSVDGGRR